jgi:hypothetical protein
MNQLKMLVYATISLMHLKGCSSLAKKTRKFSYFGGRTRTSFPFTAGLTKSFTIFEFIIGYRIEFGLLRVCVNVTLQWKKCPYTMSVAKLHQPLAVSSYIK